MLDTIGFGDTRLPPETVVRSLRDTALEAPGGIDALLFVMKKERVSAAEQEIFTFVTGFLFGSACLPNMYLIVTRAGRLAKEPELREPWLQEQKDASPQFASIIGALGSDERVIFVENSDPNETEDEDDRQLCERRRARTLADMLALLRGHTAPPYRHGIMRRSSELLDVHMEEMKRELRLKVEQEVREELSRQKATIAEDRERLQAEVEGQRRELKVQEEDLQRRFEEQWLQMRDEFVAEAKNRARGDLEPLAKEIVEKTEKKSGGRRCSVM